MKRRHGIPEPQRRRRGVVLIVVLGILALFSLVGVMFITTAQQAQQSAQALAEVDLRRDPPQALLERAMLQVLVGSTNRGSSIGPHSLLEDMYGPPTLRTTLQRTPVSLAGGAFLGFTINTSDPNASYFKALVNLYAGRVLTMTSGPFKGKSTRIVGWYPQDFDGDPTANNVNWTLRLLPFDGMVNATTGQLDPSLGPQSGDEYLINGHPFSGRERAPNRAVGDIGLVKEALNPRLSAVRTKWTGTDQGQQDDLSNPPYANEDYDAADSDNMHLAHVVADPQTGRLLVPMPSYHRPDLLIVEAGTATPSGSGETQQMATNRKVDELVATNAAEARKLLLRPLPADHHEDFGKMNPFLFSAPYNSSRAFPLGNYAGSKPQFYWDVDNDNDGEPDSVWLDLGFPISSDEQGRKFKPLFAVYVQSQDGKLNLNAHGQWNDETTGQAGDSFAGVSGHRAWTEYNAANSGQWRWRDAATANVSTWVPHGVGLSPASVDPTTFLSQTEFFFLLHGRMLEARPDTTAGETSEASVQLTEPGRYGEPDLIQIRAGAPTVAASTQMATALQLAPQNLPRPGRSLSSNAGTAQNADDNFPGRDYFETNTNAAATLGDVRALSGYGSPVDLKGAGGVMIGPGGHPVFLKTQSDGSSNYTLGRIANKKVSPIPEQEYVDDPHELNLYSNLTTYDQPFKPSDLEFLLRGSDPDFQALHYAGHTVVRYDSNLKASYPQGSSRSFKRYHLRHGSRLRHLLSQNVLGSSPNRSLLTTDSWDVTTPVRPLAAAVYAKLQAAGATDIEKAIHYLSDPRYRPQSQNPPPATTPPDPPTPVGPCLPPEAALGVKMNLNRPWGNGVVDGAAGSLRIVDYPGLVQSEPVYSSQADADRNLDGETGVGKDALAPQMYARQLFMLAMISADGSETASQASVRRIAQWAVNAVDFRDQDNIMTGFEVDLKPFTDENSDGNPWDVDGLINTDESNREMNSVKRAVVWGMELSPVLISENIAFHDVRTKDLKTATMGTVNDTDSTKKDPTFDQFRRPEGNLVIELYSPRNPRVRGTFPSTSASASGSTTWGTVAEDLYTEYVAAGAGAGQTDPTNVAGVTNLTPSPDPDDPNTDTVQSNPGFSGLLDLGRAVEYGGKIHPVWRIAVVKQQTNANTTAELLKNCETFPDFIKVPNASPNPARPAMPSPAPIQTERLIYFTPIPDGEESTKLLQQDQTYTNYVGQRLPGGSSTVSVYDPSMGQALTPAVNADTAIVVTLHKTDVLLGAGRFAVVMPFRNYQRQQPGEASNTFENKIYIGEGSTAAEMQLQSAANQSAYVGGGFAMTDSGSTPLQGAYTSLFDYGFGTLTIGCAGKAMTGWAAPAAPKLPELLGLSVTEPILNQYSTTYQQPTNTSPTTVNGKDNQDGYSPVVDTPFDTNNPWVNLGGRGDGVASTPQAQILVLQRLANPLLPFHESCNPYIAVDAQPCTPIVINSSYVAPDDPADPPTPPITPPKTDLKTSASTERGVATGQNNLWDLTTSSPAASAAGSAYLYHSLGMVNQSTHGAPFAVANLTTLKGPRMLFGMSNAPAAAGSTQPIDFPWVVWNNRPFVNPFELMLVPASSASMFPVEMQEATSKLTSIARIDDGSFQYSWLTPFCYSSTTGTWSGDTAEPLKNLYRIFEYVGLPTAFSGGEKLYMPTKFEASGTFTPDNYPFNAPFNRLPSYREPGRVNLNAILDASGATYEAVIGKLNVRDARFTSTTNYTGTAWATNLTATWSEFSQSIRGGSGEPQNLWALPTTTTAPAPSTPTSALNMLKTPFRSYFYAAATSPAADVLLSQSLFRKAATTTGPYSLFDFKSDATHTTGLDASRHPYYRFYTMQRLSQTTTPRSNIYAVWITMGNFEVEPVPKTVFDNYANANPSRLPEFYDIYPDGYRLKGELGWDTGEIKRRRAFFVVDRTIPVGFERGRANNAFDAVTLQRIIE